jgi:RNA polymerase sigma-70 factor (ECF subfamily)
MLTDEHLMLEFQRGSKDAFTELFARYREPIFGYFRRRLANMERAEELAQETFLAVLRGVTRYEPRALFRTYLYGIALLQLMAERRKNAHRDSTIEPIAADPPAAGDTESTLDVRQALENLEPDEREVLMLREYEQLSYAEIAALQRVPINTVRSRLFRARMALRELLMSPGAARRAG